MKKSLIALGLTLALSANAADISTYSPIEDIRTLPGYTDLSGATYIDGAGVLYVDNRAGRVDTPTGSCYPGGDLEAVVEYVPGKVYAVNEAQDGVNVLDTADCQNNITTIDRRFRLQGFGGTGGDGIEGIEVHNGTVYLLEETTGTIYTFIDDGISTSFSPQALFTIPDCPGAGDLAFNGDNIVAVCDGIPVAVEYTLGGQFVSQLNSPVLTNAELVYFTDTQMCIGGEPAQEVCLETNGVIEPPAEPIIESCTVTGTVDVDIDSLDADGVLNVTCTSLSGTITINQKVIL